MKSLLCFALFVSSAALAGSLEIELVNEYHILERSQTLLMHRGHIVVGRTGEQGEDLGNVERFDPVSNKLQDSIGVSHEIRELHRIDECRIFVTGTQAFTTIDYCEPTAQATTRAIPMGMIAHQGAPHAANGFLFTEPNSGLFHVSQTGRSNRIGDHISMTTAMESLRGMIWIGTYYNLWRVDPQTDMRTQLLTPGVYGEKQFHHFKDSTGDSMVASVEEEAMLYFFDSQTGDLQTELAVDGDPHHMTTWHECLVVAFGDQKRVDFLRMNSDREPEVVASWDVAAAGDRLKHPTNIAIDGSGKVFLRSSYPCPLCTVTQSSLFAARDTTDDTLNLCR